MIHANPRATLARLALSVWAMLLCGAGCSSTGPKVAKWEDVMHRWFKNAAAQPNDPPFAHWSQAEEELFLHRIGFADVALVGQVVSVSSFSQRGRPKQVSFTFKPSTLLRGNLDRALDDTGELILQLSHRHLDFRRALAAQRFLPGQRFLAFLKEKPLPPAKHRGGWQASLWRPPPPPKRVFYWALYHPEPRLLAYVQRLYRLLAMKK